MTAKAEGAQKIYWLVKRDGHETVAAVDSNADNSNLLYGQNGIAALTFCEGTISEQSNNDSHVHDI